MAETYEKKICTQCGKEKTIAHNRKTCPACRRFNARVSKGEILPPTTPDLTTEGYKEPMQAVVDGFGYYGAITRTKDSGMLQCHICGHLFVHLGAHVRQYHSMPAREYKMKFGLRIKDGLVAPVERERLQKVHGDNLRQFSMENLAKAHEAFKAKQATGWQPGGDQWKDITRNERGLCKEQTLAKIKHVAALNDGVPTEPVFISTYGKSHLGVVLYWFGSWENAVTQAGFIPYKTRLHQQQAEKLETVIVAIRDFYDLHGKTPETADFNTEKDFPGQRWITKQFGSLNAARRAAGVPELIHVGNRKWVESTDYLKGADNAKS